jgi:hypothetical protein
MRPSVTTGAANAARQGQASSQSGGERYHRSNDIRARVRFWRHRISSSADLRENGGRAAEAKQEGDEALMRRFEYLSKNGNSSCSRQFYGGLAKQLIAEISDLSDGCGGSGDHFHL